MSLEVCLYCGEMHETGDGFTFLGMAVKTCPNHPENPPITMIDAEGRDARTVPFEDYAELEADTIQ